MGFLIWYAIYAVAVILLIFLVYISGIVRYVGNNRIAIVEKLWAGQQAS